MVRVGKYSFRTRPICPIRCVCSDPKCKIVVYGCVLCDFPAKSYNEILRWADSAEAGLAALSVVVSSSEPTFASSTEVRIESQTVPRKECAWHSVRFDCSAAPVFLQNWTTYRQLWLFCCSCISSKLDHLSNSSYLEKQVGDPAVNFFYLSCCWHLGSWRNLHRNPCHSWQRLAGNAVHYLFIDFRWNWRQAFYVFLELFQILRLKNADNPSEMDAV